MTELKWMLGAGTKKGTKLIFLLVKPPGKKQQDGLKAGALTSSGRAENPGPKDGAWQPPNLAQVREPRLGLKPFDLRTGKAAFTIQRPYKLHMTAWYSYM